MDKLKIMRKLDEILPDKWRISEMDEKCDLVKVVCPIGERYGGKDFEKTISMIEKAINANYDGGGAMIGGSEYDNYFYLKREKKAKKTTKKSTKKTTKKVATKKVKKQ